MNAKENLVARLQAQRDLWIGRAAEIAVVVVTNRRLRVEIPDHRDVQLAKE